MRKATTNCLIVLALTASIASVVAEEQVLLIGTNAREQGIYASSLNLESGEFAPANAVGDAPRPSFLALHPRLPLLYAVTQEQSEPAGGVRAFRIDSNGIGLELIDRESTGDEGSTHLEVCPNGEAIIVANYTGGSTTLLPLDGDGKLGPLSSLIQHQGASVNQQRQRAPHAHGVAIDHDGNFACVADLGTDEVIVYRIVGGSGLARVSAWDAKPGAGPRHLTFHPHGRWLYSINELDSTLTVLSFDRQTGTLTELQTIDTLPADFQSPNTTAEVVVHPSGRYVYISNRGHDSTAAFAIDGETGRLRLIEIEPTQGGHPRFIGIDPSGKFLIAANRDANNLVSFGIDPQTGGLKPTGYQVSVPQPVCVVFPQ
ncbi:MAG: lactonase family protein [Planctomycetota bacterium]